jgi:hypothetical protein
VLVERAQNIVGVFWSSDEPTHVDTPQFIEHPQIKKRVSLKALVKVLSTPTLERANSGQLQALKAKKPKSAGESIQFVEDLVDQSFVEPPPLKRKFSEIESDDRSVSANSDITPDPSIDVKMEYDEETSNAALILNDVSKRRVPSPLA